MNKVAIAVGTISAVVIAGLLLTRKAEAAPVPTPVVPTEADILASKNLAELDAYYEYIGELYITKEIDQPTYITLYNAYVLRFNQLIGGS